MVCRPVRRRPGRWLAGLAAATAIHILAAAGIVAMAPEPRFETWADGGGGELLSVSLHDPNGRARRPDPGQAKASPLDQMLESLAAPDAQATIGGGPANTAGAPLSELFGEASDAAPGGGGKAGVESGSGESGGARAGFDYGAQASVPRRRPGAGSGPVGPCWGRPERPVPVVMAILLDKDGGLVGRPRIVSAGEGPGDSRAAEYERTAMRAMAGCAPFSLAPPGVYEAYRIDFSRERGSLIRLGPMAAP